MGVPGCGDVITIHGVGASFPAPIYDQWTSDFYDQTGVQINYQSKGSGEGISQIKAKTVDFGATDAPLGSDELAAAGLTQFPLIVGGVVPVINLSGIGPGELRLTPSLLGRIFMGDLKKWNDSAIQTENDHLTLPDKEITVVRRSDASGTTWMFTNYLNAASPEWQAKKLGASKDPKWFEGSIGGKGNPGVASAVKGQEGAIGYVEYTYAVESRMPHTQLKNKAGKYVQPTTEAFVSATSNADWQSVPNFAIILVDQPGEKSWPITGASFILIHKEQPDAAKAAALLKFFTWCYRQGGSQAEALHFVPLPPSVYQLVEAEWDKTVRAAGLAVSR